MYEASKSAELLDGEKSSLEQVVAWGCSLLFSVFINNLLTEV